MKHSKKASALAVQVLDDEAKYFYNELHRWYYDT